MAAAILSKSAIADESRVKFDFDIMQNPTMKSSNGSETSIYNINQGGSSSPLMIGWTTQKDIVVDRFELFVLNPTSNNTKSLGSKPVQRTQPVATVTETATPSLPFTGIATGCLPPCFPRPGKRGSSLSADMGVDFQVSDSKLWVEDMATLLQFEGKPLYFRAFWAGSGDSSFSRAFTVLENGQAQNLPAWTDNYFVNPKPLYPDGFEPSLSSPTPLPPLSADISQPSSKGGLPTGAIAGIAVGCAIVVIAIIGFLVWFFLRRRQQARDDDTLDAYRNGRTRTDELMAEKEANAGVDASPHSPYSDEGQRDSNSLHNVANGAGAAAAAAAALVGNHKKGLSQSQSVHDRSYTPYSDRQESMARSPSTHAASIAAPSTALGAPDSPTPSRAVPRGTLATPYAHLVEEGMTEEEIRRLEDEERALDAAIEQSTRRP